MKNYIDTLFYNLINDIKSKDVNQVYFNMVTKFRLLPFTTQLSIQQFLNQFNYWGKIEIEKDNYEMLKNKANAFKIYQEDYIKLYEYLSDYKSKYILFSILNNFYNFNFECLKNSMETLYKHYFDLDLMPNLENEIFVDVGAFTGDSVKDFINSYGLKGYKKIYCYEICKENIEKMKENLKNYTNIFIYDKAVIDDDRAVFYDLNSELSANKINENGSISVKGVALDNDIREPISMVKMDIEGGEYLAIKGMKEHIKNECPKLLISVYHNNSDLIEIPKLILSLNNNYNFYIRYYGGCVFATEIVLIALPKNK